MCGATTVPTASIPALKGLSPRVWGNLLGGLARPFFGWSIPTCVGQPTAGFASGDCPKVYPHVCGATPHEHQPHKEPDGLSPRVWGNQKCQAGAGHSTRSIPTCVGQPGCGLLVDSTKWVYPHVCGATPPIQANQRSITGLSPRVWGNPSAIQTKSSSRRSIPTCVGQPPVLALPLYTSEVYPHVCGAT